MSGRIPADFIRDLLDRLDIVDVIRSRITLKKQGANHAACCPFHQEKTPSFTVSSSKQFYHCFGCGAHGNALDFVMQYEQLNFVDAIEELARNLGIEVPREAVSPMQQKKQQQQKTLYQYLQQAQRFFQWQLRQTEAEVAVKYLKSRGISGELAQRFALGYSPDSWDALKQATGNTSQDNQQLLLAGLLIKNDRGRIYDRFRQRIMFPIRDSRGRTIGFGGRTLEKDGIPKYLNSPETPVYHKGNSLYGLYEATHGDPQRSRLLVVEGYMDVIALAQFGFDHAVATLGTALTQQQLRLLTKHTKHIIFCFDGDRAGKEAAWRALNIALPIMTGEHQIQFLFLPEGEDPDSLIRQSGPEHFETLLKQASGFSDYLLQHFRDKHQTNSLDGKAQMLSDIMPLINKIPQGSFLSLLLNELASQLNMTVEALQGQLSAQTTTNTAAPTASLSSVDRAIAYLVQYPHLAPTLPSLADDALNESTKLLGQVLTFLQQTPCKHTGSLLAQWTLTDKDTLAAFAHLPLQLSDDEHIRQELNDTLDKLSQISSHLELDQLIEKSRNHTLSEAEQKKLSNLLKKQYTSK